MSSDLNTKLATSNSIQEEWNLEKIDNVCELVREPFTPSDDDIRKYVGLEHIEQGTLKLCGIGSSSCVKSNKLQFRSGQILFGKLRPYFRKVIRPDFDGVCSTDILVIDSKKGYDNGYLFYFFANNEMIEEATRSSEGTRMPRASWKYLSQLKKPFPSLPEQRAIAEILSSLDDKIKLNRRMNATLEQIAQAIFKQWFIDFEFPDENGQLYKSSGGEMVESELGEIPRGWEVKSIDEIADFLNGLALQKYPPEGDDYLPVIKIRELKQGITDSTDKASPNIDEKYIIDDGDVLFSWSGSLECCLWSHGKGALNQHLFKVTSEHYPKWFYYFWIMQHLPAYRRIAKDKTTTMGHIKRRHLSESLVLVPPMETIDKMDVMMNPLFEKTLLNNLNSLLLSLIRDLLLPKLMSGRIRLS